MLSIEEIKLLIEKLEKAKGQDLQKLIDSNLQILKDIESAVDANNKEVINRLDMKDLEKIFRLFGEEKEAKKIALKIINERQKKEIDTKMQKQFNTGLKI